MQGWVGGEGGEGGARKTRQKMERVKGWGKYHQTIIRDNITSYKHPLALQGGLPAKVVNPRHDMI
jgi:hypothetical protein